MKRKLFAILMAVCLLSSVSLCAGAAGFYSDSVEGAVTGSTFVSGYGVTSTADINGIAFLAGENIRAQGRSEYLAAAARTITVTGDVRKDSFLAGQDLTVQGSTGRDLFAALPLGLLAEALVFGKYWKAKLITA